MDVHHPNLFQMVFSSTTNQVAKIVEVLQGTELPEALGWEYQLEAGEAVPWIVWDGETSHQKKVVMKQTGAEAYHDLLIMISMIVYCSDFISDSC